MKDKRIDQLYQKLDESIAFHQSLNDEITSVQHDAGEQAKHLSRLNGKMAMLEGSAEADELLARKFDSLKAEMDEAEAYYKSLQSREKKLQMAEMHAAKSVQTLQSELKIIELKSGRENL